MTTPAALLIAQAEALVDTQSHREAWRAALTICLTRSVNDVDGDNASYWQHEIAAFDRTFHALGSLAQAAAQPVEYLEIDWRTDGHDCTALSVFDSIAAEYRTTCGKPAPDAEMATTIRRVKHRLLDWFGSYREEIRTALQPVEEQAPRAGEREITADMCKAGANVLDILTNRLSPRTTSGEKARAIFDAMLKFSEPGTCSRQPEQTSQEPAAWLIPELLDLRGDLKKSLSPEQISGLTGIIVWSAEMLCDSKERPRIDERGRSHFPIALYTSPRPAPALPADWVAVPREPTEEMLVTAVFTRTRAHEDANVRKVLGDIYKAMLAAAPPIKPQGGEDE